MDLIDAEKMLPLDTARTLDWLPHPLSFSTIWSYTQKGLRGVTLEHRWCAGKLCTSEGAMRRFFAALSTAPAKPGTGRGRKSHEQAKAYLASQGIK